MAKVGCLDGTVLSVLPVPVLDRGGTPYEVTLRLERDGAPFGSVGERCGWFLAAAVGRLRDARPDALPESTLEAGLRSWARDVGEDGELVWRALQRYLPRDRELFAFRSRDPDDLSVVGELRVGLHEERHWTKGCWRVRAVAVLDAWGDRGHGVRALLAPAQLEQFLAELLAECAAVGARYDPAEQVGRPFRPAG